ncbi:hypothetical protein [Holzapfeliella sp. JNUCC 72]
MQLNELIKILEKTGLPVVYHSYSETDEKPPLPWVVVIQDASSNLMADNKVYSKDRQYHIEYYFEVKEPEKEELLEDTLTNHNIPYSDDGDIYIDDEQFFMKVYHV